MRDAMMRDLAMGFVILAVGGLLSGCAETVDDGDGAGGGSFAALEAEADGLVNEIEDLAYTDPASLPATGAATYEGVVGLNLEAIPDTTLQDADLAGRLELTVNFAGAGDAVTGTASDFVGVDEAEWGGTLIVDDGALDRNADPETGDTLTADLAGELTDPDGAAWTVDAGLAGDFAGDDPSHVLGSVDGSACSRGDCGVVTGGFVGER